MTPIRVPVLQFLQLLTPFLLVLSLLATAAHAVELLQITFDTVALSGDPAPGAGPGVSFKRFSSPSLNNAGETPFYTVLTGPGVDFINDEAIFFGSQGTLGLAAQTGPAWPGPGSRPNITGFSLPVLNDAGKIAVGAILPATGAPRVNYLAVVSSHEGISRLVAPRLDPASGVEEDIPFTNFDPPVLNSAGNTTFLALLSREGTGRATSGIFSESDGMLRPLAVGGDPIPAVGLGVSINIFSLSSRIALNDADEMITTAHLRGTRGLIETNSQ